MVREIISLNDSFKIFAQAGLVKLMMHLKICYWILKQVYYVTGVLFFVSIARYGCFEVMSKCQWTRTFVLENLNVELGSRMF